MRYELIKALEGGATIGFLISGTLLVLALVAVPPLKKPVLRPRTVAVIVYIIAVALMAHGNWDSWVALWNSANHS